MTHLQKKNIVQIPIAAESFETAASFIEQGLTRNHISREIISETMLMFEALFHNLLEQYAGGDSLLTLKMLRSFGEINVILGFEGQAFDPYGTADEFSPESDILQAYGDKFDCRYSRGFNSIRIVVKRSFQGPLLRCFVSILLAIFVYLPLRRFLRPEALLALEETTVLPLIRLFTNAMLMVGAPVPLFSLIRNLTDTYILAERSSSGRRLQIKTFVTSLISVLLGMGTGLFLSVLLRAHEGYLHEELTYTGSESAAELISSLVPSNILEPFDTYMPFPIILTALLITYAFCSVGAYIDVLRRTVDICYRLFSRMLNVVMFFLPFACFLSILTPLLAGGFEDLLLLFQVALLFAASLLVMAAFYLLRLWIGGVRIGPFLRGLPPMLRENFRINSAIDAVPYNIRYCVRTYHMDRKRLLESLPILAQTNLDGNCFLIMLIAMVFIFFLGIHAAWIHILIIALLVLFLSFGAPNQPGGILIGTLILLFYLRAENMLSAAVYLEVFFGSIQNIINVIGDIVTTAIEDRKTGQASAAK